MDNMDNMNNMNNINVSQNLNDNSSYNPNMNQSFNTSGAYTNQQNFSNSNYTNNTDEELLRAFIGKNYEKITTKTFNWAGFFLTTFYMLYRKMYLYAFLLIAINSVIYNIVQNFMVTLLINILVGFFVNKLYVFHAKQKINNIKMKNPQVDINTLKNQCVKKGGTSVGSIFIVLLIPIVLIIIGVIALITGIGNEILENSTLNFNITTNNNEESITQNDNNQNDYVSSKKGILLENVKITGYSSFGSQVTLYIDDISGTNSYSYNTSDIELIKLYKEYSDYLKINIYYTQSGNDKSINDIEVFLKSTNENISNIKDETELREKLGVYTEGTYTDTFTLSEIGMLGFGTKNNTSYTYQNYIFVDDKNNEYEMKYINTNSNSTSNTLNLVEGKKYTVTFEVEEGIFDYDYIIKSVK